MSDTKEPNPNTSFGYQPNSEQRGYQPKKGTNEGHQPTKPISTQPPTKGSNVQPAKNDK